MTRRPQLAAAVLAVGLLATCGVRTPEVPRPDLTGAEAEVVQAVDRASREVEDDPRSAEAWGRLGERYRAGLWLADAAACFREAERLDPGEFRWPYLLGHSLMLWDLDEAAAAFERAVAIDPGYAPARVLLAQRLARLGRLDRARAELGRAASLDPQSAHAWAGLGQLALSAGDWSTAREHLERAVAIDPRHGEAHRALAQVRLALGDEAGAAAESRAAETLPYRTPLVDPRAESAVAPAGSVAHVAAGRAHMAARDFPGALVEFEAALGEDPVSAAALYGSTIILIRLGRYDEAGARLGELEQVQPDSVPLWNARAQLHERRGELEQAAAAWRESLTRDPADGEVRAALADACFRLGTTLAREGRTREAAELLAESVRLDPENTAARANLGTALAKLGVSSPPQKPRRRRRPVRPAPRRAWPRPRSCR